MKSSKAVLTILATGVLWFAVAAQAQFAPMTLKASVPFEFSVGRESFPAGDYTIQRTGPYTLALRDADGKFLSVIQTSPVQLLNRHEGACIHFRTVGVRHVLEQVWQSGMTVGYQLYVPRERRSLVANRLPTAEHTAEAPSPAGKR